VSLLFWGMVGAGVVALLAGIFLLWPRLAAAHGLERILLLGPMLEAVALAIFAAEHFFAAGALSTIVPPWLPGALFWTYFVGAALLATAISLITFRCVRWSALLLALLFLIIVATIDLPNLKAHGHERLFWTLTLREMSFAGGAMVLAGSLWPGREIAGWLTRIGRLIVSGTFLFYSVEHFVFPLFVPGVPLEKKTPGWFPAPVLLAWFLGITLFAAGIGLLLRQTRQLAAAGSGAVLILLTILFYVPILLTEMHTPLAIEGVNYVGDTLLFAATALLAGFDVESGFPAARRTGANPVAA
jgi:uncharacterized membrane protein